MAIGPGELDYFNKPASGLEQCVGQVERENRAISLLPNFQIVEEPPDVGEEEVTDLSFSLERGYDLGNGFFKSQCL